MLGETEDQPLVITRNGAVCVKQELGRSARFLVNVLAAPECLCQGLAVGVVNYGGAK